ncbi:interleukin-4 receptor subunit alpha isoform X1 [Lagopus muta]|uniref:interleukin-4 receptor subunit alpha isoform X1 n=2 Tax=Lagopus muta TaxID=64668 RepID=UPI00209D1B4C|nr:interleukin-4 receptor subunit alpha isoform X1 [Lagopus muta]XP_048817916.1 interleukin-4 receptor subunit alpha isoform X1 [Lagopus muta]XP_048817917.1 interleukin-4 receptor subunit alpha isoform X1 [Lagopus muta]XP_048817918.1 interleukin-4 receptor subunit alpha isoform X1 [Lagopus muta]
MMARFPVLHTLWILLFSYATMEVMATEHIQEFACFTDYAEKLICHWKVPAQLNCSQEFLLYYRKEFFPPENVCVPENGEESFMCTCTIYPDYFVSGLTYILALQFNGTNMWNSSVTPAQVVKPRPPKNLAVEKAENGNFNLSWEESYAASSMLFGQPVIYEVKYWSKQRPEEVTVTSINYQAKSFEITASSLQRGYDYIASIRCNYTDYPVYWSDWSDGVEFHCDYQVTSEDILHMAVPISCILIMGVAVTCYFCFTKMKKEWWDQIPNPAKSHLVVKNVKFSVLNYIDEMKFPFYDSKPSHVEKQISCKNCQAQSLSSQNFKEKDNIRNIEKSCSCCSKPGVWFPKGINAVLTPETVLVEESVEICERLTDIEAENQEKTSDQITVFEPCEGSVSMLREHAEHNDALANMFMELLADEKSMQDDKDPDIITSEIFQKLESENLSQKNLVESAVQSQQSAGSHRDSPFTEASQDEYNCSTTSRKSAQSEESFESGYRSSSTNSASLDARDSPCKLQQSLLTCSSESQRDSSVLIWESLNKPAFDRISSSAYKGFDTLISPSMEPCGSAYKSFHAVMSPSVEPCGSAYKSFHAVMSPCVEPCGSAYKSLDTLASPSVEPCSSAYRSFDALMSQSVASSSLNMHFENMCLLPSLTQSSEAHVNDGVPAFLPEEEIHKQAVYQNLQKEGSVLACPAGPQPSGYKSFDAAVKCSGAHFDSSSEFISKSLYEPLVHLLYNSLEETPPYNITHEPDGRECLIVQDFDSGIAPGAGSREKVSCSSDDSLSIVSSHELLSDNKDENTSRDKQLLHFLELNCQDFNGERAIKGTKHNDLNCCGEGVPGGSSDRISTDFQCAPCNHLRMFGNSEENKEVANRCSCSAANLPDELLDGMGLTVKTAEEPLELLVSDKSAAVCADNPHLSDSRTTHNESSGLAPAVRKRSSELLMENNRKNEKKVEFLQVLAQEDNYYMKVA